VSSSDLVVGNVLAEDPREVVLPDGVDEVVYDITAHGAAISDLSSVVIGNRLVILPVRAQLVPTAQAASDLDSSVWESLERAGGRVRVANDPVRDGRVGPAESHDLVDASGRADLLVMGSFDLPSVVGGQPARHESPHHEGSVSFARRLIAHGASVSRAAVRPDSHPDSHLTRSARFRRPGSWGRVRVRLHRSSYVPAVELLDVVHRVAVPDGPSGRSVVRFDLQFYSGELVVVAGERNPASMALVNLVAGLEEPDTGVVMRRGERFVPPCAGSSASMPAGVSLGRFRGPFSGSALEFVAMSLMQHGLARRDAFGLASGVLDELGVSHMAAQPMEALSAHNRSIVMTAGALAGPTSVRVLVGPFRLLTTEQRVQLGAAVRSRADGGEVVIIVADDVPEGLIIDRMLDWSDGTG
jgi:ABC-type taurine transport system ATPase subunit